jgi:hypothetical protein
MVRAEIMKRSPRKLLAPRELATKYFRLLTPGVRSIRGAGAMYGGPNRIPMNPKLRAILVALESGGISVSRTSTGSPANCDWY